MRRKGHILVVDDDRVATKILSRLLTEAGYSVSEARSGKAALSLLSKNAFDLVLADLVMEEMSGLELLKRAKLRFPERVLLNGIMQ